MVRADKARAWIRLSGDSHQLLLKQRGVKHKCGLVFPCELYFYAIFLADISCCGDSAALVTRKIALHLRRCGPHQLPAFTVTAGLYKGYDC